MTRVRDSMFMKIDRKRQVIYGVALTGALTGLIIDRLHGGPAQAVAASSATLTPSTAKAPSKPEVRGPGIARVFETTSQPAEGVVRTGTAKLRDAFGLTPELRHIYQEQTPAQEAEKAKKVEDEAELRRQEVERFVSTHKLKGTSVKEGAAWALIDDKVVQLGEALDGFQLEQVERYRVQLRKDELTVVLSLPMPF